MLGQWASSTNHLEPKKLLNEMTRELDPTTFLSKNISFWYLSRRNTK